MTLHKLVKSLPNYQHFSDEEIRGGIEQMTADLQRLAKVHGCVAAGFALEVFSAINADPK